MTNRYAVEHGNKVANQASYPFTLPSLPYSKDALAPHISANTLDFHHGKHHNTYVTNLNNLLKDTDLATHTLESLIVTSFGDVDKIGIYNNAAQIWNHTFFWHSMKPYGGGRPPRPLMTQIENDFGTYEAFVETFKKAATTQFGSGWAWLTFDGLKLHVIKTSNADLPLTLGHKALITLDVWEHSYYLDYQNLRLKYVETFLEHLVNWDFALANLEG